TLDRIPGYNLLRDPQLEELGIAPYLRRAFDGEPTATPAVEYDVSRTVPDHPRAGSPKRWVNAVAYPLKDRDGRVREVVLIHEDIT
ncbi:PAS domain-containing protein, partial [Acinetobacter baumannii]